MLIIIQCKVHYNVHCTLHCTIGVIWGIYVGQKRVNHEIFVRIDMKHSYFSNYFIICLQSIFSVEIMIELCVVCSKLIHVYALFLFSLYKSNICICTCS